MALSIFLPFIALVVALIMMGSEKRPARRTFLKNWAIGSGAWLATGFVVFIVAASSLLGASAGCKGGIDQFSPPTYTSTDNVHWTATYQCVGGGTTTRPYHGNVP